MLFLHALFYKCNIYSIFQPPSNMSLVTLSNHFDLYSHNNEDDR